MFGAARSWRTGWACALEFRARQVREGELWQANVRHVRTLSGMPRTLDQALEAVVWSIARSPEMWPQVPGTSLRVAKTDPYLNVPRLRVFFTIDDENTCTLHAVDALTDDT
jgi:hypothetical protein